MNNNVCIICGRLAPDNHHVKTKGAGGKETIPLCREHHSLCHAMGRWSFAKRFGLIERFRAVIGERKFQQWVKTQSEVAK